MSKSLGNGVDPMDVIKSSGADALRFYLATSTALGTDLRYDEEKVKSTWNFINKIWNAARFVLMNTEDLKEIKLEDLSISDEWILTKYENTIKNVRKFMDRYEFQNVGTILYDFIWDDFCDSYIEMAKFQIEEAHTQSTLQFVLTGILKMLHPFMPYVTDEIYHEISAEEITISAYPEFDKKFVFNKSLEEITDMLEFVKTFRNVKQENNIGANYEVYLTTEINEIAQRLLKISDKIINHQKEISNYQIIYKNYKAIIYYEKVVTEADLLLKEKQIEDLKSSIARREKLLSNENYVKKAPAHLVEEEKKKLTEEKEKLANLTGDN